MSNLKDFFVSKPSTNSSSSSLTSIMNNGTLGILTTESEFNARVGEKMSFDNGFLLPDFEFTGSGYKYNGDNNAMILLSINIQYRSVVTIPYEIATIHVNVNGVSQFVRTYGRDMQERMKDDFLVRLNNGDVLEFLLDDLHNAKAEYIAIEDNSHISMVYTGITNGLQTLEYPEDEKKEE